MKKTVPHIIQYQGSKRKLAPRILQYMPEKFNRLVEPFAGMAAVTLAVAQGKDVQQFWINDINEPIVSIIENAVANPEKLADEYEAVWKNQFSAEDTTEHYYRIREEFNSGDYSAANMLYLLARCVKGAVRYSSTGQFNQSPDKRRHGTKPETVRKNLLAVSSLLKDKVVFSHMDYKEVFAKAQPGDIYYMDPPYQGTSNVRDNRYLSGVAVEEFADALHILNQKGIDFLISYDGACGHKVYGEDLPKELECCKLLLNAGRSTQATLLGRKDFTYEALYVSKGLQKYIDDIDTEYVNMERMA